MMKMPTRIEVIKSSFIVVEEFNPGFKNTMGWDEAKGQTVIQRTKNSFVDYRYWCGCGYWRSEDDFRWFGT